MTLQAKVQLAINAVCPNDGVSFGSPADKASWLVSFKDEATEQQRADAQAAIDAFVETPDPDSEGFIDAAKAAMGGIVASNALAKAYPLFHAAVEKGVWQDVQALLIHGHTSGVLGDPQYGALKALAAQYNLPVTLP